MTSRQRFSREKLIVYLQLSTKNPKSSSKLVWAVSLDVSEENERLAARLGIVAILQRGKIQCLAASLGIDTRIFEKKNKVCLPVQAMLQGFFKKKLKSGCKSGHYRKSVVFFMSHDKSKKVIDRSKILHIHLNIYFFKNLIDFGDDLWKIFVNKFCRFYLTWTKSIFIIIFGGPI